MPEYFAGIQVLTKEFVVAAHERNLKVHVWTVNDTTAMKRLLKMGVDGIITDYPDRLQYFAQCESAGAVIFRILQKISTLIHWS